jgi:nucleoside 2-deoxyribosyltransferase
MPDVQGRPYVYLAGPDVFYPDANDRAEHMKEFLAERDMVGLFPMDSKIDPGQFSDAKDFGIAIGNANEEMMRKADIIIANVEPWRGPEADDGTAYEVGFMAAQGKLVVLHSNDPRPFADRVVEGIYGGKVHQDGPLRRGDSDNMMIEDFPGFADNLMLVNAAVNSMLHTLGGKPDPATAVQRSFRDAVNLAHDMYNKQNLRLRPPT